MAGASAVLGYLLTLVLPEPARRNLEDISGETPQITPVIGQRSAAVGDVVGVVGNRNRACGCHPVVS